MSKPLRFQADVAPAPHTETHDKSPEAPCQPTVRAGMAYRNAWGIVSDWLFEQLYMFFSRARERTSTHWTSQRPDISNNTHFTLLYLDRYICTFSTKQVVAPSVSSYYTVSGSFQTDLAKSNRLGSWGTSIGRTILCHTILWLPIVFPCIKVRDLEVRMIA